MINLPIATKQPFPAKNPWFDVSQFLAPGLTPYADQSVIACLDDNFIHYSFHITIDQTHVDPDYIFLSKLMPKEFRPAANAKATGWFSLAAKNDTHGIEFASSGWIGLPVWRTQGISMADYGMIFCTLTAARGGS